MIRVRSARPEDGPRLREIERAAGEAFRTVGLASVADDAPPPAAELAAYAVGGRSWVAADDADLPVAYVLVDEVDGNAHVAQISVLPGSQGEGVGRALLERVRAWAVAAGWPAMTLTTFREVPWNRPLYEHLGFVVLPDEEIGPELRTVVARESDRGLDAADRVCMRVSTAVSLVGGP